MLNKLQIKDEQNMSLTSILYVQSTLFKLDINHIFYLLASLIMRKFNKFLLLKPLNKNS